ncbi:MAG: hypothetical protein AAFV98_02430 [Chloroflexota bacterium]
MANDIDYIIWSPDGDIYFIPKDRIGEFKLEKDSQMYEDISSDPITKAVEVAAAVVDESGDWQPLGATCFMYAYANQPEDNQPKAGDKLAFINLDFNMNNTFNNPDLNPKSKSKK